MKKKGFLISVVAILFFALSGISVNAGDDVSAPVDLGKAIAACQQKVRELEQKFIALEYDRSGVELSDRDFVAPQARNAECVYGSEYYGYLSDN